MDLFLCQNDLDGPEQMGVIDAGTGLVLRGKGDGTFTALTSAESGIDLSSMQSAVWVGDANGDARPDLWVHANDMVRLFHGQSTRKGWRLTCEPKGLNASSAVGAKIQIRGGISQPVRSIHFDDGQSGHSGNGIIMPAVKGAECLWIQWPNGDEQSISFPSNALRKIHVIQGGKVDIN
jgi:hypothetical protein